MTVLDSIRAALVEELTTLLREDAVVHLDVEEALHDVASGGDVLVLDPPTIEFQHSQILCEWTARLVVGGLAGDRVKAWNRCNQLLTRLQTSPELTRATPFEWAPDQGTALIGYELTITTNHDI